jgi:hypothetical protein
VNRGVLLTATAAVTSTIVGVVVVIPLLALGAGGFALQPDCAEVGLSEQVAGSPSVLGPSTLTLADLRAWWDATGRGQPEELGSPIEDVLALYPQEAEAENVRGDLAIAQAIHETGWFTSSDTARNNFAGIRHFDHVSSGNAFPDVATGVRAHVQLLKKYAAGNDPPLAHPDVAPTATAQATTWEQLAGTWATSPDYWTELSGLYDTMLRSAGYAEPDSAVPEKCDSPPVTGAAGFEGAPGDVPLTNVEGITVHTDIAPQVAALVAAARADGHELTGSGYRSPERQIELRRAHCGTSHYAIYEMPSSECTPPTARPGSSNHELGLAVDFDCDGTLIHTRSSECFTWLAANGPTFGLHNLPSEPWHWSVNGN